MVCLVIFEVDIVFWIRNEVKVDFIINIFNVWNVKCGEFFVGVIFYEVFIFGININFVFVVSKCSIGKKFRVDLLVLV